MNLLGLPARAPRSAPAAFFPLALFECVVTAGLLGMASDAVQGAEVRVRGRPGYYQGMRTFARAVLAVGSDSFMSEVEKLVGRRLRPLPGGRPRKKRQETR